MESEESATSREGTRNGESSDLEKALWATVWLLACLLIGMLIAIILLSTRAEALDAQMDVLALSLGGA